MRKAFELYVTGLHSYQTVADVLREQGFALTGRGKSVTGRTVELMLNNPFYVGVMKVEGELYPHNYPPLISEWTFKEVQRIKARRHRKPVKYAGKQILLRGLIKCGNCDGTVSGYIKKEKYVYYSCHNSKRLCKKKCFTETELLDEIMVPLGNIVLTDEQINDIADHIEQFEAQEQKQVQQHYENIAKKATLTRE